MGVRRWWGKLLQTAGVAAGAAATHRSFAETLDDLQVVPIHGRDLTLRLDPQDSLELLSQPFESSEVRLVKRLISPGQTVVDVGANIGYYTLLFSSLVGEHGRVISFEPDPDNAALLHRNLTDNNCQNVDVHQSAVGAEQVELKLYRCAGNNGMHRAYESICCGDAYVTVQSVVLDELLADEPSIDFLKMDIEGFEYFALQGMSRLLQRHSPTILIEFSPSALAEAGVTATAFIRFLLEHGYGISRVSEAAEGGLEPLDADDLLTRAGLFDAQAATLLDRERCQDLQEFGTHLVTAFDQMGKPFEILQNWICQKV
jgi:FkbM family methyltransferase